MHVEEVKLRAGKFYIPVKLEHGSKRTKVLFPFNRTLLNEVKMMEDRRWHGFDKPKPHKSWSIPMTPHNIFQLDYLRKDRPNPYEPYDVDPEIIIFERPLFDHQMDLTQCGMVRKHMIWAAEMGTGKTLSAIEVMERSDFSDWWWIGPLAALAAVKNEFIKWKSGIWPTMMTYEELRRRMDKWEDGAPAPRGVIFDESSRVKTHTALRSKAALGLADGIRADYGRDSYIILMSGTPAPKSPLDWWFQCRIACPGFLKEGSYYNFRDTVAIYEERKSKTGGTYPHLVCWKDSTDKCGKCGQEKVHENHDVELALMNGVEYHTFDPMVNEVARLYRRMKGLVVVKFKKDCLDLPEKTYRIIECKPKRETLRAASLIAKRAKSTIVGLILLRELSDGFQYTRTKSGDKPCTTCNMKGEIDEYEEIPDDDSFVPEYDDEGMIAPKIIGQIECPTCKGSLREDTFEVGVIEVECPKEPALIELLEDHIEYNRLVVYCGFTASIDRVVKICQKKGWGTMRVDGRGLEFKDADGRDMALDMSQALNYFQDDKSGSRVVFVGQPGAAGMGLTLTASPSIVYWSNDHNGESRVQSEDRIHRPGMIGANIIDLIHLPTDLKVLNNLKSKRRLELMSLGQLSSLLETSLQERE